MKKKMKLLSLAAALCGAVACSSGGGGGTTGGPGTTGSSGTPAGSSTGAHASGTAAGSGTASGGSPTGGGATGTGGSSTGGTSTGTPPPSTYPCVDGGPSYMPTNPPDSLPFCWCNPGDAGTLSYYQIINSCPPSGSSPDLSIPAASAEDITGLAGAALPLQVDAGVPGFVGP